MTPQEIHSAFVARDEAKADSARRLLRTEAARWQTAKEITPAEIDALDHVLEDAGLRRTEFISMVATLTQLATLRDQVAAVEAERCRRSAGEFERRFEQLAAEHEKTVVASEIYPKQKAELAGLRSQISGLTERERLLQLCELPRWRTWNERIQNC